MYRQIPVSNKICFQRNFERDMEIHRQKINNIKPSVDQGKPKQISFLKSKKPAGNQMHRDSQIRNENAILLNKIVNIMSDYKKPGMRRSQTQSSILKHPGSLNKNFRKRNLVNIVIENEAIGKRISEKKSCYNVQKWEQDRKQVEKYITNKCEYQYKHYQPTQTQVKFGIWDHNQSKSVQNKTSKNFRLAPMPHTIQPKKIFNTTRRIGLNQYFIEVKIVKGVFLIQLENVEKVNQSYKIELLEKEGLKIWNQECQQKPDLLLERIRVDERSKSVFFKRLNDNVSVLQESKVMENQSSQFNNLNQNQNNQQNNSQLNLANSIDNVSQNKSHVTHNENINNSPPQQIQNQENQEKEINKPENEHLSMQNENKEQKLNQQNNEQQIESNNQMEKEQQQQQLQQQQQNENDNENKQEIQKNQNEESSNKDVLQKQNQNQEQQDQKNQEPNEQQDFKEENEKQNQSQVQNEKQNNSMQDQNENENEQDDKNQLHEQRQSEKNQENQNEQENEEIQ